jgi:hypothetical protein
MNYRRWMWVCWYLPSIGMAAVAGLLPDTFHDSPDTTIPHAAAYYTIFSLVTIDVMYTVIVVISRLADARRSAHASQDFPGASGY